MYISCSLVCVFVCVRVCISVFVITEELLMLLFYHSPLLLTTALHGRSPLTTFPLSNALLALPMPSLPPTPSFVTPALPQPPVLRMLNAITVDNAAAILLAADAHHASGLREVRLEMSSGGGMRPQRGRRREAEEAHRERGRERSVGLSGTASCPFVVRLMSVSRLFTA